MSFLISLGFFKAFGGTKLYLQIIPLIVGALYLLKNRKIHKVFYPLFALFCISIISVFYGAGASLVNYSLYTVRLTQVFLLVCFANYCSQFLNLNNVKRILISVAGLSVFVFILELIFLNPINTRSWLGYDQRGFLVGEPNFSALLYFCCMLLALNQRLKSLFIIFLVLGLLTYSRSFIISSIFYFGVLGLGVVWSKVAINRFMLGVLVSYPGLVYLSYKFSSNSLKTASLKYSPRYYLHEVYVLLGLDSIWGSGFQNGYNYYISKIDDFAPYLVESFGLKPWGVHKLEQHSIFIQTFSEFGIVGYVVFCFFLFKFLELIQKRSIEYGAIFVSGLVFCLFLNCYNEVVIYLVMGYFLNDKILKISSS